MSRLDRVNTFIGDVSPPLPGTPRPEAPARPTNALHETAAVVNKIVSAPAAGMELVNQGFAQLTAPIAALLPAFPAATLTSIAVGLPHAHIAHPPSGPPPIPPTPLPPVGPVMFGCCVQVLINGKPAARCGDLGLTPTCCGIPPIYEIFTGSSSVFIGGARAARATDITYHCKPIPPAGAAMRGAAMALKMASVGMMAAGMAAQGMMIAGDTIEAVEADSAAMSAALGLNASMMAAQMANDAIAIAMGAAMGKDPCVPPGTPGALVDGSPNVLIGGMPLPALMNIAKGLLKLIKGLKGKVRSRMPRRPHCGC